MPTDENKLTYPGLVSRDLPAGERQEFDSAEMAEGFQIQIECNVPTMLVAGGSEQDLAPNVKHFRGFRQPFATANRTAHGGTLDIRTIPPVVAVEPVAPAEAVTDEAVPEEARAKAKGKKATAT